MALFVFICFCKATTTGDQENTQVRASTEKRDAFARLAELSKAAVAIKIYSIVKDGETILPDAILTIENLETKEKFRSIGSNDGVNVFVYVPPGYYRLYSVFYNDPFAYPVLNLLLTKANDRNILLNTPQSEDSELTIYVKPRQFQYGGDYTLYVSKKTIKITPPDFENEVKDMKKASELLLREKPHSRWVPQALEIMELPEE
ncbi:MAG: hypothetical protein D6767_11075 [Candidatus Hydrogenedentota bacterium]|nr:MAG: hypothetical protein D6767_11075 [Candidatus Hydrogenedentota bacterium]